MIVPVVTVRELFPITVRSAVAKAVASVLAVMVIASAVAVCARVQANITVQAVKAVATG